MITLRGQHSKRERALLAPDLRQTHTLVEEGGQMRKWGGRRWGSRRMGGRFVWFVLGVIGLIVVIVWVVQRI
jgi:hypothetical protein